MEKCNTYSMQWLAVSYSITVSGLSIFQSLNQTFNFNVGVEIGAVVFFFFLLLFFCRWFCLVWFEWIYVTRRTGSSRHMPCPSSAERVFPLFVATNYAVLIAIPTIRTDRGVWNLFWFVAMNVVCINVRPEMNFALQEILFGNGLLPPGSYVW